MENQDGSAKEQADRLEIRVSTVEAWRREEQQSRHFPQQRSREEVLEMLNGED